MNLVKDSGVSVTLKYEEFIDFSDSTSIGEATFLKDRDDKKFRGYVKNAWDERLKAAKVKKFKKGDSYN